MDSYCPICEETTTAVEQHGDGGRQFVCGACGVIIDDSPIRNPDSPGNNFEQREGNVEHWSALSVPKNSAGTGWSHANALRLDTGSTAKKYCRSQADKRSALFTTISDSIASVGSKLNLSDSTMKQVEAKWNQVRGRRGLAGVKVRREHAAVLGIACISWVCRAEGADISTARLALVSGVEKEDLLGAVMKLQKVLGTPVSLRSPKRANSARSSSSSCWFVSSAKSHVDILKRSLNEYYLEEAEILATCLMKLKVIPEQFSSEIIVICAYYLSKKFVKAKWKLTLKTFHKRYSMESSRRMELLEEPVKKTLSALASMVKPEIEAPTDLEHFWSYYPRDLVKMIDSLQMEDVPDSITHIWRGIDIE